MNTATCPYQKHTSPKKLKASFEEVKPKTGFPKFLDSLKKWTAIFSISSIRNSVHLGKTGNFQSLLLKQWNGVDPVVEVNTFEGLQYVFCDPTLIQLILSQYRSEKNGLFHVPDNKRLFVDNIVRELFPEEAKQYSDEELESWVILTADASLIPDLRNKIMGFLKPQAVQEAYSELEKIAAEIFSSLTPQELESIDPADLAFEFAITVVSRLFTNYQGSREAYIRIAKALMRVGKRIEERILRRNEDEASYQEALHVVRTFIEENVAESPPSRLVSGLQVHGLPKLAMKMYLYFFYLAGTETTAAVTHYLLLMMGRKDNKHLQELARSDANLLKKCVIEALRLNPPAYVLGRVLQRDICMVLKDEQNQVVWSRHFIKGARLLSWVGGAARNPKLYEQSERFDPTRFASVPNHLPWFPFASGPHTCPGQFLARAEIEAFLTQLLAAYQFECYPDCQELDTKGIFTLHADPDKKIRLKLTPLEASSDEKVVTSILTERTCPYSRGTE